MAEVKTVLPQLPFDGQEYIDSFRIKWRFDGTDQCWRRIGTVPDLPVATELQPGLLSAKLKQLLDSIPERGGHFGIVARPLLSLASNDARAIFEGTISKVLLDKSGSQLVIAGEKDLVIDQYAGKVILFRSGLLRNKTYLVFTNDVRNIFIEGDATAARPGDKFQIINPSELNPNGVILGDIMLVSESIDITCLDSKGIALAQDEHCPDRIEGDNPDGSPAGFNFTINKNFLDQLCVVIPGCKGPRGDRGPKGPAGKDGTGDGPTGETGDVGADAPVTPNTFTGVKIIDIDDIYDMAVVGMELDAANNKLNVIKAKVRTPTSDTPADQVIASPIIRGVNFTDDSTFNFELTMPDTDPVGTPDIDILRYPEHSLQFQSPGENHPTQTQRIKLSALVAAIGAFWDKKLLEFNDDYNKVLRTYIETKDSEARKILADMAMKVAECEFQLPIEFCLGISPDACHGGSPPVNPVQTFNFPLAPAIFGSTFKTAPGTPGTPTTPGGPSTPTAVDLGTYIIPASTQGTLIDHIISVKYPNISDPTASTTLPAAGYIVQWLGGSIKSSETDWLVGSTADKTGLEARFKTTGGTDGLRKMPIPTQIFNAKEKTSVEKAYQQASLFEKTMNLTLDSPGSIDLKACLPGADPQGAITVKVLAVFNGAAPE